MEDNLEVAPGQTPPGTAPQPPATAPLEEGEGDDEGSGRPSLRKTIFRLPLLRLEAIPSSGDVAPCFAFELKREGEESVPHVVFEEAAGEVRRLVFATKREGNWSTEAIASEPIPSPPPAEPCAFRPAIYIDRRGVAYVAYRTDGSHLALAMKRPGGSWEVEDDIVGAEVGSDFAIGAEERISGDRYQLYFRIGRRLAWFSGDTSGHSRPQFFGGEPGDRITIAYDKPYPFPVQHLHRFNSTIASEERPWRLDFPAGKDFDIVPHPRLNAQSYAIVPEASPSAALHLIEFRRGGSIAERDIDAAGRYPSIDATPELRFFTSYSHEGKLWVAGGEQSGPWSKRVVLNSGDPATEFRSTLKADGNTLHLVFHNGASMTLQYLPRSTF